mgnify:CR=1 FL=1
MEQPVRPRLPEPSPPRSTPVVAFTRAEREAAPLTIPPVVVRLLGALLGLVLLREAAPVLIPIAVAVALMFVLSGPVERLHRLGAAA